MVLLLAAMVDERGLLLALLGFTMRMALPMEFAGRWCWPAAPLDSLRDAWEAAICRERSSRNVSVGYKVPAGWATPRYVEGIIVMEVVSVLEGLSCHEWAVRDGEGACRRGCMYTTWLKGVV